MALFLLRSQRRSERKEGMVVEAVDIVEGDTAEEARERNVDALDISGWKTVELRPLTLEDIKKYLLKSDTYFTLHEPW